jgi:hypothetical protein
LDVGDLGAILGQFAQALRLLGDAFTGLLLYLFKIFGLEVPAAAVQLATVIFIALTIWKLGGAVSKVALLLLILLALGVGAGLLGGILSHIPFIGV